MFTAILLLSSFASSLEAAPPVRVAVDDVPPVSSAYTQRLVYVASGAKEDFAVLDWAVNIALNRRHYQVRLNRLMAANAGEPIPTKIAIIDLAALSVDAKDYHELANTWERLALIESNYLGVVLKQKDGTVKRLPSSNPAIGPMVAQMMATHNTNVPIIESRQFLRETLSTVDGGLYYQFAGIPDTLDGFTRKFSGTTLKEIIDIHRSGAKVLMLKSKVTGRPRGIVVYHGLGGHVARNQGLLSITIDSRAGERDPDFNPFRNPIDQKAAAFEALAETAPGFQKAGLFNGEGKRQNSAPDDVVKDHKVPDTEGEARLQGAISCLRCHGLGDNGNGGDANQWQPAYNDLLDFKRGLWAVKRSDDPDKVFGLLSEQLDQPLQIARDSYLKSVTYLTSQYGLNMNPRAIAERLTATWQEFQYDSVDQEKIIKEIGQTLQREFPKGSTLETILIPNPISITAFRPIDPMIDALMSGKQIVRREAETIMPDLIANVRPEK